MEILKKNKIFILLFLFAMLVRLQVSFLNYLDFKYNKYLTLNAKVVNQYLKEGKRGNYYVLKLKNDSVSFYTTSKENLKNLLNENVKLTLITSNVSFKDYLFTFYAPSFNLKLLFLNPVEKYIEQQHDNKKIQNIYKALFLGESLDFKTRERLSTLGISHLVALSGLHLGFISLFLYLLLTPVYKMIQKKFPYRNRYVDLAAVIFLIEFIYLFITSFPPSLIRAYILEITVFLYAYYLKEPFSLKVLFVVFLISLILFGQKVFSLGYFLSIAGVFYIYLFFRYFKADYRNTLFLSLYMFCVMFVISHTFFGNFNLYQLFSPIINVLFAFFYPVSVFLHVIGLGGVFDGIVVKLLSFGSWYVNVKFNFLVLFLFLLLSIVAFYKKWAFYGINITAVLSIVYAIGVYFGV
jgi:competence protein ComEC